MSRIFIISARSLILCLLFWGIPNLVKATFNPQEEEIKKVSNLISPLSLNDSVVEEISNKANANLQREEAEKNSNSSLSLMPKGNFFAKSDENIVTTIFSHLSSVEQIKIRLTSKKWKELAERVFKLNVFPELNEEIINENPAFFNASIPYILIDADNAKEADLSKLPATYVYFNKMPYKISTLKYFSKMYDEYGRGFTGDNTQTIGELLRTQKALPLIAKPEPIFQNETVIQSSDRYFYRYSGRPTPTSSVVICFMLGLELKLEFMQNASTQN